MPGSRIPACYECAPAQQAQPRHHHQHGHMQPGQEGALIGEEGLGLHTSAHQRLQWGGGTTSTCTGGRARSGASVL